MISIYQYVADNRIDEAGDICNKYGYSIPNGAGTNEVAECLERIVGDRGSEPLYEILGLHPDKEILAQVHSEDQKKASGFKDAAPVEDKKCKCGERDMVNEYISSAQTGMSLHQGNLFLIAAALILSVAIVVTNK